MLKCSDSIYVLLCMLYVETTGKGEREKKRVTYKNGKNYLNKCL